MFSSLGTNLVVTTFGESHGPGLGVVVDGLPAGIALEAAMVQEDLDRRRPGVSRYVSPRQEGDKVEILSGVAEGRTLGSPVAMLIRNRNQRSADYTELAKVFRPGHADFTYHAKYGLPTQPGGGRSSGRETVGRVAAGAVARALLTGLGVEIAGGTIQVGPVKAKARDWAFAREHPLRAVDPETAGLMADQVEAAREQGDSIGGVVEVVARGVPAGWGEPVFAKLDALLGGAMFSIGAVKGVEIGDGFSAAARRGSENNDQMGPEGFLSNHAGGVLGGISSGQPIVIRLAVKPTPSISLPQETLGPDGGARTIEIKGRHDPCICPRIVAVAEAMTALVLADAYLTARARQGAGK